MLSTLNWTPSTAMLSFAVAVIGVVLETVAPDKGDVIETVGGVVSITVVVNVKSFDTARLPAASLECAL